MKILDRDVSAIRYADTPILNAYVHRKLGDCQKEIRPDYKCLDNCEGQ